MDAGNFIPDSLVSRVLDIGGGIMLIFMKAAHGRFEKQSDKIQALESEHAVFKVEVVNMKDSIDRIEANGEKMLNILLTRKH